MHRWIVVVALALVGGCAGSTTSGTPDGAPQQDATAQHDVGTDGTVTPDGGTPDGGAPDGGGAAFGGHRGTATVSGAVQATSPRFRVIMSTGQAPGGNTTASSAQHKLRGGLVGATQGQ